MLSKNGLRLFLFLTLVSGISQVTAQETKKNDDLIQFSGIIVTGDSLKPVPFVTVLIKNSRRGTISDFFGYFSFVAKTGDTLLFSHIGFKQNRFIVPDSLTTNRYSLIQVLITDTVLITETYIYPWPTKEQFKMAFMQLHIPDDDLERAKKNLQLIEMHERFKAMGMDGSQNFKNFMHEQTIKLYYAGQYPSTNLLNPIAWAKFIKAWKNGDLKIEKQ